MNLATLRIEGEAGLLSALMKDLTFVVDSQWREGDRLRSGGTHSTSGFCATITEASSPSKLLPKIRTFIAEYEKFLEGKDRTTISGELAVGITIGETGQHIGSVLFGASDLLRLGQLNLALSVSAYHASDLRARA